MASHPTTPGGGGGGRGEALPYMAYTTCRWTGYGFWHLCPEQGIIVLGESVLNRL